MERLDDLGRAGFKIIQRPGEATFSLDAVLLAHFIRAAPGDSLCDLGTGTGVIPLLVAARGGSGQIVAVELQPELADLAERNIRLNGLSERVRVVTGDLRQVTLADLGRREPFDVATANPPFRKPGTGRLSPRAGRAIARHELQCTLDEVVRAGCRLVRHGGRVSLVYLAERLVDLVTSLRLQGLEPKRMRVVRPRPNGRAKLVLVEARAGGRGGLTVEADLVVRGADGLYTSEMRAIYGLEP